MNHTECFREPDLVDAVRSGEWPRRVEPALRDHVASCGVCSEVLTVALALRTNEEEAVAGVRLPTAAHVWWRAAIRARQEAAITAARPITVMEGIAAAAGVGLGAGAIALGWSAVSAEWHQVASTLPTLALTIGGGVAMLVAVPVALYFVLAEPKG